MELAGEQIFFFHRCMDVCTVLCRCHEPNGIKDPEYSIECGVQELKAALISAEVEKPIDMEHIKLALQGDNFGNL